MNWTAILRNDQRDKVNSILDFIGSELLANQYKVPPTGLLGEGLNSITLFLAYYAKIIDIPTDIYLGQLQRSLSYDFSNLNLNRSISLCSGTFGNLWLVEHLVSLGLLEKDTSKLYENYKIELRKLALEYFTNKNIDYLHGGIGTGIFYLEKNDNLTHDFLNQILDQLNNLVEINGNYATWKFNRQSITNELDEIKYDFCLGLAHGVPSIIVFLAYLYNTGLEKDKLSKLIYKVYNWFISTENKAKTKSRFGSLINTNYDKSDISRIAWCYGDLGISIALLQVGQILNDYNITNKAVQIALSTTTRTTYEETSVLDAGFCHGSSGVAHIYNRLYHYTGIEEFKTSALYWLDVLINQYIENEDFKGYKFYMGEENGWQEGLGILEGLAGIGLTLLAAIRDEEPEWDRALLLSYKNK